MNDGQCTEIQIHFLIFPPSYLIAFTWHPTCDLIPADYIPGIQTSRTSQDKNKTSSQHTCGETATWFPDKWPLLQSWWLRNRAPGRTPSATASHNIAWSHRALQSPSLIRHMSNSRVCLLRRGHSQCSVLPCLPTCNFLWFFSPLQLENGSK